MIDAAKAMDLESYDTESAEAALKTLREAEELLGAEPTQAQVDEMLQKTSTSFAPWHILESVDKKYARIKALQIVVDALEKALD